MPDYSEIEQYVVTAAQMRAIEARVFAAGMPVAALMEKVAGLIARRFRSLYPHPCRVGVLVGPGHNGADALVVARELHLAGYSVHCYSNFSRRAELTQSHWQYADHLGISLHTSWMPQKWDVVLDGIFGFGLERPLTDDIAEVVHWVNRSGLPIVSIDLPSGLHADTGEVLGSAVQATHTLCLGLWKLGLLQDRALPWVGQAELLPFGLPLADIQAVVQPEPLVQRIVPQKLWWPLPRPVTAHKYQVGHLLLVGGSRRYAGAILLAALAARATGVGMLTIAVPASLQPLLFHHVPDALVIACPETAAGNFADDDLALAQGWESEINWPRYDAIAAGPGMTMLPTAIIQRLLSQPIPLVLDADGLNILSQLGVATLAQRSASTILTPHWGEFRRLFIDLANGSPERAEIVRGAARRSGAIVLLKGARVAIGHPDGSVWINPTSTAALARGGSGDVLTGLLGGLLAQASRAKVSPAQVACTATWWHAQAGLRAAQARSELGVDAHGLTQFLLPPPKSACSTINCGISQH